MYRAILTAVTVLSFSQVTLAADKSEVLKCVDAQNMQFEQSCVNKTFEKHSKQEGFFDKLASKEYPLQRDALASISLHTDKNLIEVKTYKVDVASAPLLASK